MSETTVHELRSVVITLLKKLSDAGVDLNLEEMKPREQKFLVNTIAKQTAETLLPKPTCCSNVSRFFKSYCVAEVTPELIEKNAGKISLKVKEILNNNLLAALTKVTEDKDISAHLTIVKNDIKELSQKIKETQELQEVVQSKLAKV
jgi:hypothetical protein